MAGEAVAVDLGGGRWLTAPLKARYDNNGIDIFGVIAAAGDRRKFSRYSVGSNAFWTWIKLLKRERPYRISTISCVDAFPTDANLNTMQFDHLRPTCPTLVLVDIARPDTARIVSPVDFEKVLGPGVSLRSVTVQMTDDPPTKTIRSILPWLDTVGADQPICPFSYATNPYPPCAAFYGKDFVRDD